MQVNTNNTVVDALSANNGSSRMPIRTLDQDDFIKLLVAQMTSQDPMNPQSNTDFAAQMAQFTALEQSRAMSSALSDMRTEQQILQANGMLGRTVTLQTDSQTIASGTVQGVQIVAGTPKIMVGGVSYDLSQVLTIAPAAGN